MHLLIGTVMNVSARKTACHRSFEHSWWMSSRWSADTKCFNWPLVPVREANEDEPEIVHNPELCSQCFPARKKQERQPSEHKIDFMLTIIIARLRDRFCFVLFKCATREHASHKWFFSHSPRCSEIVHKSSRRVVFSHTCKRSFPAKRFTV